MTKVASLVTELENRYEDAMYELADWYAVRGVHEEPRSNTVANFMLKKHEVQDIKDELDFELNIRR